MSKFFGKIGFSKCEDKGDGIWKETYTEKSYYGDFIENNRKWEQNNTMTVNENISINDQISIVADSFAYNNVKFMKYVLYLGTKWKINSVRIRRPRIILYVSEIYNPEE